MRALIVYESMYGNTHVIADHIADGLRSAFDVTIVPVGDATAYLVTASDLLVVGGPTHAHGMSSTMSRRAAVTSLDKPDNDLSLDPAAKGPGLRDLFDRMDRTHDGAAAAFDTRINAPAAFTGRACRGIARRLRKHGFHLALGPESFLVDKQSHLLAGEAERATAWGRSLAEAVRGGGQRPTTGSTPRVPTG